MLTDSQRWRLREAPATGPPTTMKRLVIRMPAARLARMAVVRVRRSLKRARLSRMIATPTSDKEHPMYVRIK